MTPENTEAKDEMVEKAKQLLLLADLVDKYPKVVARRVAGLIYILIGGGISFATLILMSLQNLLGPGDPLIINVGFVILSLVFSWIIGFKLIVPLTRSYSAEPSKSKSGKGVYAFWGGLATAIVVSSFVTFQMRLPELFPPALQFIMGCGFTANYVFGKRDTEFEFYSREHLYFAIVVFLSIFPMLIFPVGAYLILIVVNMGGIYSIGIHMLITAERLLLESKGQG